MKAAVVVLADPGGGEDAAGRMFNALAAASDFRRRGQEVTVLFQGAGTRWPGLLSDPAHPFHGLFKVVHRDIAGASEACATVFGARRGVAAADVELLGGNPVDGVGELPSLAGLTAGGYHVLTF